MPFMVNIRATAEAMASPAAMEPARLRVRYPMAAASSPLPETASNMVYYMPPPGTRGMMAQRIKSVAGRFRRAAAVSA